MLITTPRGGQIGDYHANILQGMNIAVLRAPFIYYLRILLNVTAYDSNASVHSIPVP